MPRPSREADINIEFLAGTRFAAESMGLAFLFRDANERYARGSILRQEIYALDSTDAADRPYAVSERNYTIEVMQPQGGNPYAVFLVHAREAIEFHYERKLYKVLGDQLVDQNSPPPGAKDSADPRVSHALTLGVRRETEIGSRGNFAG
jgi:hypothetical protein